VISTFKEGEFVEVNDAFLRLSGYKRVEIVGRTSLELGFWLTKEERDEYIEALKRDGKIRSFETVFRKKSGEIRAILQSAEVILLEGKKHIICVLQDITEQKQLRENLQYYIVEATKLQEEERKHIARELHDDAIQYLSSLYNSIYSIQKYDKERQFPQEFISQLRHIRDRIGEVINRIRRLSHQLRPDLLDRFGLLPSLELLVEETNQQDDLKCRFKIIGIKRRIPEEVELMLFRIVQELIRNISKHSRATKASLVVKLSDARIRITVTDDGRGFKLPKYISSYARRGKFGLVGIQERTRLINGNLMIDSSPGRGTKVSIEVAC
jgi:PAS domain S-box-containing protein